MSGSSLQGKTVRPGSLGAYSYYRSARRPDPPRSGPAFIAASRRKLLPRKLLVALIIVVAVAIAVPVIRKDSADKPADRSSVASSSQQHKQPSVSKTPAVVAPVKKVDACAGNTLDKLALVSISQRHLWACEGAKTVYETPVITGMSAYDATVTPVGTYHIYSKQTDVTLTGSDITGSWSDPVDYWMPFLSNKYGIYGFHDATWRSNDAFGKVSADSSDASHGCVELPLAASKWLYGWAVVGTTVSIKN